ncbi:hypothetical protein ACFQVA_38980 [Actinomadura keratinilytica]
MFLNLASALEADARRRRPRRADQREPGGGLESAAGPDRPRARRAPPVPQNHQETTA